MTHSETFYFYLPLSVQDNQYRYAHIDTNFKINRRKIYCEVVSFDFFIGNYLPDLGKFALSKIIFKTLILQNQNHIGAADKYSTINIWK